MKIFKKVTNGIILIVIGILHTNLAVSADGFGKFFWSMKDSYFFNINQGMEGLPLQAGMPGLEIMITFWFFYFGIFLLPLGLLIHSVEIKGKPLAHSFTISFLIFVMIGSYMVPSSGMTYIMLPHAIFMLVRNYMKARKHNSLKTKSMT